MGSMDENTALLVAKENTALLVAKENTVVPIQDSDERRPKVFEVNWLRRLLSFLGPGFVVAVGYVDPGNWATGLEAGAKYHYNLLSVILLSNLMAMVLQHLAIRLGVFGEMNLAVATRKSLTSPWLWVPMWLFAEIAIIACDLAEVIGGAIALQLLFGIPMALGILSTTADVLLFLTGMGTRNFRLLEMIVVVLVGIVGVCFAMEVWLAKPSVGGIFAGTFLPDLSIYRNNHALFVSLGIIGATVMPHNLYLHSGLVQNRTHLETPKENVRMATWDSNIALVLAFFVNASILITAAAGLSNLGQNTVASLQDASALLDKALGSSAGVIFALALLASGQSSTITGTLAGQIVFEGFVRLPIEPWKRRLITRSLAVTPALGIVMWYGPDAVNEMLLWSQTILSLQLPFAIVPLVLLTSDEGTVGRENTSPKILAITVWIMAVALITLNFWMLIMQFVFHVEIL